VLRTELWLKASELEEARRGQGAAQEAGRKRLARAKAKSARVEEDTRRVIETQQVCAVLCYAVLCCVMLCCAMLCCAVLCYAMLCYAMLCCAILYYVMLCCAMIFYTRLSH
jgi:hypothetical protein